MVILTESNLGKRQKELNEIVKEAAANHVEFDQIKDTPEESDVDKLFKIDLASKYLNIEYIIDILKSGDSLYISRALKCGWLYGDDFAIVINADNLHKNVMPFMSIKMKKKLLTAISMHVRNKTRAAEFCNYCMDMKYTSIALKFLNFTNENFKLEMITREPILLDMITDSGKEYLKNFIGLSFTLADAYVATYPENCRMQAFRKLSYLYTVSDIKYLDLFEKYVVLPFDNHTILSLRISKSIMKQHKDRVLCKPSLYVKILHKAAMKKYSTEEDAKIFAVAVLHDDVKSFWDYNYCNQYKCLFDKIQDGKFEFAKQIFSAKYPGEEFETHFYFHEKQFYHLMTTEEKETWALKQLASESEILGAGNDYKWYKFVNFGKAFEEMKKFVLITPDTTKRADMMFVLVDTAKTQRDLEKLLKHYYERHANEQDYVKENFLDRILQSFNVFEFDDDCWSAWNNMFHNLNVYRITDYTRKTEYKIIALIYHIIKQKDVPTAIINHIHSQFSFYTLKYYTDKLKKEEQEMVYQYLFDFYMDEIRKIANARYGNSIRIHLRKYIHSMLDLLYHYDKTKLDCPGLLNRYMKRDWNEFCYHSLLAEPSVPPISQVDLLRDLKKDAKLLIKHRPEVEDNIHNCVGYRLSQLLKKLKIYFSNDIAKVYLNLFNRLLVEEDQFCLRIANAAAHGIFQLGDESLKVDIMNKYAPTEAVINHHDIKEKLLWTQKAICSQAYYSRPPVPLTSMLLYIKGDYVHFCLPMFYSYLSNLPRPRCIEFVEALLNTAISIQKHSIRIAFECFDPENLNTLVLKAWKKSKNVSLRHIIFKALHKKISTFPKTHHILFDTLKTIALTIGQDDNDEIFNLLVSCELPEPMMLECIEIAWNVVSQLPPKEANLDRMSSVIRNVSENVNIIRPDFVRGIIDTFLSTVFKQAEKGEEEDNKQSASALYLIDNKWDLAAKYIINIKDKNDLQNKTELAKHILNECIIPQKSGTLENRRRLLKTALGFVSNLEFISYDQEIERYENVNILMQFVLKTLQDSLQIEYIYRNIWNLRVGILAKNIITANKKLVGPEQDNRDAINVVVMSFAKELCNLIKELIETGLYFNSFIENIACTIINKLKRIKVNSDMKIRTSAMMNMLCLGIMSFGIPEFYFLVLYLLPESCNPEQDENYITAVTMLYNVGNKEIRCKLYEKLSNSDYEVINLIQQ